MDQVEPDYWWRSGDLSKRMYSTLCIINQFGKIIGGYNSLRKCRWNVLGVSITQSYHITAYVRSYVFYSRTAWILSSLIWDEEDLKLI